MTGQPGFWSVEGRLAEISAQGDPLETLSATVDFEMFRPVLEKALGRPPRWKGGRPPFDPVLKFRMLVLQSLHGLSLEQTEYLVRDAPSLACVAPDGRSALRLMGASASAGDVHRVVGFTAHPSGRG